MSFWELFLEHPFLATFVFLPASVWCTLFVLAYLTTGVCKSNARLDGKTVILTGCTSGIGISTAFDMARRGARLIMACRNLDKANTIKTKIVKETKNDNVVVMQLDISNLRSVRMFAAEVNKREPRLDVLIHNAGVVEGGNKTTEDGINKVWATNHFGPFLLTHLLIDLLKKTGKSRIVYVSSAMHCVGRVNLKKPNPLNEKGLGSFYNSTKFANVLIANELARRLEGSGVTANSLHPGSIVTPIWDQTVLWFRLMGFVTRPMMKNIEQGAQTTIHVAVSEEVEGVSGKYFSDCQEVPPSKRTQNVVLARKYWKLCEQIVNLMPSDPHI